MTMGRTCDIEDIVLSRVIALGGRTLAEPSLKCLAAFILLMADKNAARLPSDYKHSFYKSMKENLKRRLRGVQDPQVHDILLP